MGEGFLDIWKVDFIVSYGINVKKGLNRFFSGYGFDYYIIKLEIKDFLKIERKLEIESYFFKRIFRLGRKLSRL